MTTKGRADMDVRSILCFIWIGSRSPDKRRAGPCRLAAGLVASLSLIGASAEASSQGSLASVSKGSISISVSVASRSQVSGLSDFTFAQLNSTTGGAQSQTICVWSSAANRQYSIQAVGSGPGSAFTISDDQSTTRYAVVWNGQPRQTIPTAMRPGQMLVGLIAAANEAECSRRPSSSAILSVAVESRETSGETANVSQTGSLQLLISPE
jgi:hypothetical protein